MSAWTASELDQLRAAYAGVTTNDRLDLDGVAKALGRDKPNVCRKARSLGLTNQCRPKTSTPRLFFYGPRHRPETLPAVRSAISRDRWDRQPHPRGFLGHRHTAETKARVGAAARAYWQRLTPEALDAKIAKQRATILAHPERRPQAHSQFSRARRGRRADLGGQYFRSRWEANYARYLNLLVATGQIASWAYEADRFVFPDATRPPFSFLPDFKLIRTDGRIEYHEVKGWLTRQGLLAIRRFERRYGDETPLVVVDAERYRWVERRSAERIPTWEAER